MHDYKYCPKCETEYYSHIDQCADCSVPLKTTSEIKELKEKERYISQNISSEGVVIKEGDKRWMKELYTHLESKGIPCTMICSPGCIPGKYGETFQIIVPSADAPEADRCIQDYTHEIHPELKESHDLSSQGKCPACGYDTGVGAAECPDCGLLLVIDDQEQ